MPGSVATRGSAITSGRIEREKEGMKARSISELFDKNNGKISASFENLPAESAFGRFYRPTRKVGSARPFKYWECPKLDGGSSTDLNIIRAGNLIGAVRLAKKSSIN
jgi:hypothetical protein